jgi:OmpA-OmpF porin, OOP family
MNLLANFKEQLSAEITQKVAAQFNESPEKIGQAVDVLIPMVLAGFMKRSAADTNNHLIFVLVNRLKYEGNLIANIKESLKTPDKITQLATSGSSILSQVMPDKKSIIATSVSSFAKIRNSSVMSLMGVVTSFMMDGLGKEIKSQNLDVEGLANLLLSQKDNLVEGTSKPILDRIIDTLGISNLLDLSYQPSTLLQNKPTPQVSQTVDVRDLNISKVASKIPLQWVAIGLAAIIILGGGVYWFTHRSTEDVIAEPPQEVVVPVDSATIQNPTTTASTSVTPAAIPAKQSVAEKLALKTGSPAFELAQYLSDTLAIAGKVIPLGNITFEMNTLNPSPESETILTDISAVLKEFPNAQLKCIGYVGQSADSLKAKAMSFKRAHAIQVSLMDKGIDLVRLDSEGKGRSSSQPRIDLKVVKR